MKITPITRIFVNHQVSLGQFLSATNKYLMLWTVSLVALSITSQTHANPAGGQVEAGVANIEQQASRMDINQASQKAVINWQGFNIDRGEQVNFNQPNRDASTLNRVIGNDPSTILGKMTANGNVYLVNQNGILVGKDAQINVGSLIASTANISTRDFMAGRMDFNQPGKADARIVNQGHITAQQGGLVALVAPGVENHGVITAKLGKIALAGSDTFTLDFYGDQLINLAVSKDQLNAIHTAEGKPLAHYVNQSGEIIAQGGLVNLSASSAKAVIDSLINVKGTIQAQSLGNNQGAITIQGDNHTRIDTSGNLDVSAPDDNSHAGKITLRAGQVNLKDDTQIDASAQGQGGTVLVGGDYQGSGEGIRAKSTTVGQEVSINADSLDAGNGGKVIVWADGHTHFDGNISARGGQSRGNGGLIEVSGKHTLHYDGNVDASSKHGKAGQLLLDPGDLTVKAMTSAENKLAAKPDANGNLTTNTDAAVNVQKVNYLLQNGTNVALKAGRDLTVAAKIDGRATNGVAGAGLSLNAGRHAKLNEDILTNNGAINIKADGGNISMAQGKRLDAGNNSINLNANQNIEAQHLVTSGAVNLKAGGAVTFNQTLAGTAAPNQLAQGIGNINVDGQSIAIKGNVKTNNGVQNYLARGGNFTLDKGTGSELNRLDSGTAKVTIGTTGAGNVNLNGTVLAKQAGLKITTEAGDVNIRENLGFSKPGKANEPDPANAVGSVQVKTGGKIFIDKDWNIAGNSAPCGGGDCSVKLIQTGGNDIVINGRIRTATGNILIGSDDLGKTNFGKGQIHLGNSIFTDGEGGNITINGNLHLVNSGKDRMDVFKREAFEYFVTTVGGNNFIIQGSSREGDPIPNGKGDFYRFSDLKENGGQFDISDIIKPTIHEIPTIILSAAKGSTVIKGNVSGLWKFKDKVEPYDDGRDPKETATDYTNATLRFDENGQEVWDGTTEKPFPVWKPTLENFGGTALRLVVKNKDSLGFSNSEGIVNARLFDNKGELCCTKIALNLSLFRPDGFEPRTIKSLINANQYGENPLNLPNEFHYFIMDGLIKDSRTTTNIDGSRSANNVTQGIGQEGSYHFTEFNNINSTLGQNGTGYGASNPDPLSGVNSNNTTSQTLTYANQNKEDQTAENSEDNKVDTQETIILSSRSDTANADLGRNSPATGAAKTICSAKPSSVRGRGNKKCSA